MDDQKFAKIERLVAGTKLITRLVHERNREADAFIAMGEVDDAKTVLSEAMLLCDVAEAVNVMVAKELSGE